MPIWYWVGVGWSTGLYWWFGCELVVSLLRKQRRLLTLSALLEANNECNVGFSGEGRAWHPWFGRPAQSSSSSSSSSSSNSDRTRWRSLQQVLTSLLERERRGSDRVHDQSFELLDCGHWVRAAAALKLEAGSCTHYHHQVLAGTVAAAAASRPNLTKFCKSKEEEEEEAVGVVCSSPPAEASARRSGGRRSVKGTKQQLVVGAGRLEGWVGLCSVSE